MSSASENLSVRTENCPLIWSFDGEGTWEAVSMVLDPANTDEPKETWCKELCLMWRIVVLEDGTFGAGDSDKLLLEDKQLRRKAWDRLQDLQARIDLAEEDLRQDEFLLDGRTIELLGATKYKA